MIVLALGFEAIVWVHQKQYYACPSRQRPVAGIVFPEVKRPDADRNLVNCVKFLVNYTFYKFGLEVMFLAACNSYVTVLGKPRTCV